MQDRDDAPERVHVEGDGQGSLEREADIPLARLSLVYGIALEPLLERMAGSGYGLAFQGAGQEPAVRQLVLGRL